MRNLFILFIVIFITSCTDVTKELNYLIVDKVESKKCFDKYTYTTYRKYATYKKCYIVTFKGGTVLITETNYKVGDTLK